MQKKIFRLSFLVFYILVCLAQDAANQPILLDTILVSIYGPQKTDIITLSDVQRPGIDGTRRNFDDLIMRSLKDQDAKRYGMQSTPEIVEKHLQAVFRANNWLEDDFNKLVQSAGWQPYEAREEFRLMTDINQIEGFKIYSQLIVPEREIKAYFQDHPSFEDAAYFIQRAVVPYDYNQDRQTQYELLIAQAQANELELEWSESFWVTEADLAEDKKFIKELSLHEISLPHEIINGFELFKVQKMTPRRQKTLNEMRNAIIELLRAPKAEELKKAYHKDLREHAVIVYFENEITDQLKEQNCN